MKWIKTPIGEISCIVNKGYMTFEEAEKLIPTNARIMTCIEAMQLTEEKKNYFEGFEDIRYFVKSKKYKDSVCWPVGRGFGYSRFNVGSYDVYGASRGVLIVKKVKYKIYEGVLKDIFKQCLDEGRRQKKK